MAKTRLISQLTVSYDELEIIGDYGRVTKEDLIPLCFCSATHTVSNEDLDKAGVREGKLTMKVYEQLRRLQK